MEHGFESEAEEWRAWLLRAIAGDPADVQIMYGLAGERRLPECGGDEPARLPRRLAGAGRQRRVPAVPGRRVRRDHARPREGALDRHRRRQVLVVAAARAARLRREEPRPPGQRHLGDPRRPAALHALARDALGRVRVRHPGGARARARRVRSTAGSSCATRCAPRSRRAASTRERNTFVQYYGTTEVDASLLQLPQIGFIAPDDPRMLGTVAALETRPPARRPAAALPHRDRCRRAARRRAPVPGLLVLARASVRALGSGRRRDRSARPPGRRSATTSGCSARSTTSPASVRWATRRRRCRTSPWSVPPTRWHR